MLLPREGGTRPVPSRPLPAAPPVAALEPGGGIAALTSLQWRRQPLSERKASVGGLGCFENVALPLGKGRSTDGMFRAIPRRGGRSEVQPRGHRGACHPRFTFSEPATTPSAWLYSGAQAGPSLPPAAEPSIELGSPSPTKCCSHLSAGWWGAGAIRGGHDPPIPLGSSHQGPLGSHSELSEDGFWASLAVCPLGWPFAISGPQFPRLVRREERGPD